MLRSASLVVRVASLVCLLVLYASVGVAGWNYSMEDTTYGPCGWNTFCSTCSFPMACPGFTGTDTKQHSPISFPATQSSTASSMGSICIRREYPYIQLNYMNSSTFPDSPRVSMSDYYDSTMIIGTDPGGAVHARCQQSAPFFVRVWPCGLGTDSLLASSRIMQLTGLTMFNGPLHGLLNVYEFFASGEYYEVEYQLSTVRVTGTTDGGDKVYEPACRSMLVDRKAPDLLISQFVTPGERQTSVNNSILVDIVKGLYDNNDGVKENGGFVATIERGTPLLPYLARDNQEDPAHMFAYMGSLASPPCTAGVIRIVMRSIITVPSIMMSSIGKATQMQKVSVPFLQMRTSSLMVFSGVLYHLTEASKVTSGEPEEDTTTTVTETDDSLDTRILVLFIVMVVLLSLLLIVLFTRWGLVESVLPTMFGGFDSKVMWDEHSYEMRAFLQEKGINFNPVPDVERQTFIYWTPEAPETSQDEDEDGAAEEGGAEVHADDGTAGESSIQESDAVVSGGGLIGSDVPEEDDVDNFIANAFKKGPSNVDARQML